MNVHRVCITSFALILGLGTVARSYPPLPPPVPAGEAFEGHFRFRIPRGVKVVHYYGESGPMDPSFAWELAPVDAAFLKTLVKNAGLKPATKTLRPNPANYRWPSWWKTKQIESLKEVYFADGSSLQRVWVDRRKKRVYIEFVNL